LQLTAHSLNEERTRPSEHIPSSKHTIAQLYRTVVTHRFNG
jgi:hypothetical protein